MPCSVSVRVLGARNLPIMDKSSETTDAFVEVRVGQTCYKTEVCNKTLHPRWDYADAFTFSVDDDAINDDALHIRIMDYDTYSANDPIGKISIELRQIVDLGRAVRNSSDDKLVVVNGWLPILDTLNGARGELEVSISVSSEINSSNPLLPLFSCPDAPPGFVVKSIFGLISELVTLVDPEMQWLDKIRTPRATNDARQAVLRQMSNQASTRVIQRASNLGANAVLGYRSVYDIEGEESKCVTLRVCGTAAVIQPIHCQGIVQAARIRQISCNYDNVPSSSVDTDSVIASSSTDTGSVGSRPGLLEVRNEPMTRIGSISVDNSAVAFVGGNCVDMTVEGLVFSPKTPFLTCHTLPPEMHLATAGILCARSVKCLHDICDKEGTDMAEQRKMWWNELRAEICSQMQRQHCNAVIAYREDQMVVDDIVMLCCVGTGVVVDKRLWSCPLPSTDSLIGDDMEMKFTPCSACHPPIPPIVNVMSCALCGGKIKPLLLTTCEFDSVLYESNGILVKSISVHRINEKHESTEELAKEICSVIPQVERDVYKGLVEDVHKVCRNAVVGLRCQLNVSGSVIVGFMFGTAVNLIPLINNHNLQNNLVEKTKYEPFRKANTCLNSDIKQATDQCMIFRVWRGIIDDSKGLSQAANILHNILNQLITSAQYRFRDKKSLPTEDWAPVLQNLLVSVAMPDDPSSLGESQFAPSGSHIQVAMCAMVNAPSTSSSNGVFLSCLPVSSVVLGVNPHYVGRLDWSCIRETPNLKEVSTIDVFFTLAAHEMLWAVKAYVKALGASLVSSVSFSTTEFCAEGVVNSGKSQAQCLLAVTGDIYALND